MRFRFDGVDQVRKFHPILNEEDGDIIGHQIVIALFGIEFGGKSPYITSRVGRSTKADHRGEAHKYACLHRGSVEKLGLCQILYILIGLKISMGTGAPSVHDSLGDALVVKMSH